MKTKQLLLLPLLFLFSCNPDKPNTNLDQTITIDLTKSVESQGPAEGWIEEIQFIPLETNPESYISSRRRYNLNQDNIVVASGTTVHLFSRNGEHLKSFTKQGKGPGEYGMIININLIPDRDEIMVVDPNQHKILCYDFSGNLSCEIKTSFISARVAPLQKGLFACYTGRLNIPDKNNQDLHQIFFVNREGQIISKHLPFKYLMPVNTGAHFSQSGEDGAYLINPAYELNIYQTGPGNQFFMKYRFSFGNYNLDTSLLSNEKVMTSNSPHQYFEKKVVNLDRLTVTSNTISFWGPIMRSVLKYGTRQINRKSGHVRFMELDSLQNIGYYEGIPLNFESKSYRDYFILCIDAIDMIEILNNQTPEQKLNLSRSKGFKQLATLKEDDNPVLILYKVKDF